MALRASLVIFAFLAIRSLAGDTDIATDFITPPGVIPDGNFFTFRGLNPAISGESSGIPFKVVKLSQAEFPALAGQSVSAAVLQFALIPGGINPPHIHPRSAELLFVMQGVVSMGFVDSANKLITQTLHAGEAFLFPKGLVLNEDSNYPAVAISAFGSANPGGISLPNTIFGSHILNPVLAKSFKTDAGTVDKLVSAISS